MQFIDSPDKIIQQIIKLKMRHDFNIRHYDPHQWQRSDQCVNFLCSVTLHSVLYPRQNNNPSCKYVAVSGRESQSDSHHPQSNSYFTYVQPLLCHTAPEHTHVNPGSLDILDVHQPHLEILLIDSYIHTSCRVFLNQKQLTQKQREKHE